MSLRDKAMKLNAEGIKFMDGRTKGELPLQSEVTIDDFGFINGAEGEYVVLSLMEFPGQFFFGSSVVTSKMQKLNEDMTDEDWKELHADGLTVKFMQRKSKNKRDYTDMAFVIEEIPFN